MHTDALIDSAFNIDCYEPSQVTQKPETPQKNPLPMRCIQHNKKMRFICFREEKAICDYCVTNCSENAHRLVSLKLIRAQANEKALQLKKAKEHYLVRFNQEMENEKRFLSGIIDNESRIDIKRELKNAIDNYIKAKLDVIKDLQIDNNIRILEDCQISQEFIKTFNAELAFDEEHIVNIFPIWAHKEGKYHRIDNLDPLAQDLIEVRESWKALRRVLDAPLGKFPVSGGLDSSSVDFNNTFQDLQVSLPKIKKEENLDSTIIKKNFGDDLDDSLSLFPEVELCKEHKKELHFVCSAEGKVACADCVITCNQQGHQISPIERVRDQAKQMMIYCNNMKEQYHQKWNQLLENGNIDQKIHSQVVEGNNQLAQGIEEEKSEIPKKRENYQDQMIKMIIKISPGYLKLGDTFKKLETGDIDHAFLAHLNSEIKTEIEADFAKLFLLYEYAKKILNVQGSVSDWLLALKESEDLSINPEFEALIHLYYFLCLVDYRIAHKLAISVNKAPDLELNQSIEPDILVKCDIASRITTENQLQITLGSLGFSLSDFLNRIRNSWQHLQKYQFEYDWNFERKHEKSNERWRIVHTALEAILSCSNRTLSLIIECDLSDSSPADALAKTKSGEENKNDDLPKESINASKETFLLDKKYFSRYGLSDLRNLRQLALYFRKISIKNLTALSNTVIQPTLCLDFFLLSISSTEVQYDGFANLWHTGLLAGIETRKEFELIIEEDIKRPLKILDGLLDYALPIVSKCQTIKLRLNSVISITENIEELFLKALAFEIYFLMTREHYMNYKVTQHAPLFAEGIASELGLKSNWSVSFNRGEFEKSFYDGKQNNPMLRDKIIDNARKMIQDNKWGLRDYLCKIYDPEVIKEFEENLRMRPKAESILFSIPITVTLQKTDLTKKALAEIVVGNGIEIKKIES